MDLLFGRDTNDGMARNGIVIWCDLAANGGSCWAEMAPTLGRYCLLGLGYKYSKYILSTFLVLLYYVYIHNGPTPDPGLPSTTDGEYDRAMMPRYRANIT